MDNREITVARDYHESTKLAYINLRNKPPLYKKYTGLPEIALPTEYTHPGTATLEAVGGIALPKGAPGAAGEGIISAEHASLDLAGAARMLYFSAGLLHKRELPVAGEVHYRAAASAGALYPVEAYLVAGDMPGLGAGVYHFSPLSFTLTQLRKGDFRSQLAAATAGGPGVTSAPVTLVLTAVFWRSAWKYRVRSYRYCFWDAGTILANLLATVSGDAGLPTRLVAGFVDGQVNSLLGLDSHREASLCLVPIGGDDAVPAGPESQPAMSMPALAHDGLSRLTGDEISYPEITVAHAASSLRSASEVRAWRDVPGPERAPGVEIPSHRQNTGLLKSSALGETIMQRGSTRRFARDSISLEQFRAILETSTKQLPADFVSDNSRSLLDVYIIINAVDGLETGAYHFSPSERKLELLKAGSFREEAGHLCFEQALGADASAVLYFLADLDRVLERYGNRGYRAAQLEAGVMVGNAYLCAHSLGLGATGMTFYDDDVAEFFSPHAEGKSMLFLAALGKVDKPNRVRPFRSRVGVLLDSLARGAGTGQRVTP